MSRLVVANCYQLGRSNGKFDKNQKTLIREAAKVDEEYILDINFEAETSGRLWIIDEKATEENHKQRELNQQRKAEDAAKRSISSIDLVNALVNKATSEAPAKAVKVELTEEEKEEKARLAEAKKAEKEAAKKKPAATRRTAAPKD